MRNKIEMNRKNRAYAERHNPCVEEEGSYRKCMHKNSNDLDKCNQNWQDVVTCQVFWDNIILERKINGIRPYLPYPDERAKIKAEHLNKKSKKELN